MQFIKNGPEVPDELLNVHEKGEVVFFCGAGVSFNADLPSFKGLVCQLYTNLKTQKTNSEKLSFDRKEYDTTLHLLEQRYLNGRSKIINSINSILNPNLTKKNATTMHQALLELSETRDNSIHLVTTNFDHIFEKIKSESIVSYLAPCLPIPKNNYWNGIVYLHGQIKKEGQQSFNNTLVFTSGDFGSAYLTERWASRFVSELFKNYTVCFVGYSVSDPTIRYMLDALAAERSRGEVIHKSYIFDGYIEGKEEKKREEWESKQINPILYKIIDEEDHSLLIETFKEWADLYKQDTYGKEYIVKRNAILEPTASTKQDNFISRVLWSIADETGKPAKVFSHLQPIPSLKWLYIFNEQKQFLPSLIRAKEKEKQYTIFNRPSGELMPPITLFNTKSSYFGYDKITKEIIKWLLKHIYNPELLLYLSKNGLELNNQLRKEITKTIKEHQEKENNKEYSFLSDLACKKDHHFREMMRRIWIAWLGNNKITKCEFEDSINWFKNVEIFGLTANQKKELIHLLYPKLVITESLFGKINKSRNGDDLIDYLDFSVVLNDSYFSSILLQEDKKREQILPFIFTEIQFLLDATMDLMREIGKANKFHDDSVFAMPSIQLHEQNKRLSSWTYLIELLRDSWGEILKEDKKKAKFIAENWYSKPYAVYKRLALYAASISNVISNSKWITWLLNDKKYLLWSISTRREVLRLFVLRGNDLTPKQKSKLEQEIIKGNRVIPYSDSDQKDNEYCIWLRLMKLKESGITLGIEANDKLKNLSNKHDKWKISKNEKEEFAVWMSGTGDSDFEVDNIKKILPRDDKSLFDWIRAREEKKDHPQQDDWEDLCKSDIYLACNVLYELFIENIYPVKYLKTILLVFKGKESSKGLLDKIIKILKGLPKDIFAKIIYEVIYFIQDKKNINDNDFNNLCERCIIIEDEFSEPQVSSSNLNVLDKAINTAIGRISEAILARIFNNLPNDDDGIPQDYKDLLKRLLTSKNNVYGLTVLTRYLIPLYRIDKNWTQKNILKYLNHNNKFQEIKLSCWAGYISSNRIYKPLVIEIKDPFYQLVYKHRERLDKKTKNTLISMFTFIVLFYEQIYQQEDLRVLFNCFNNEELFIVLNEIEKILNLEKNKDLFWNDTVEPFWEKYWPKDKKKKSSSYSETLIKIITQLDKNYDDSISCFIDWLSPMEFPAFSLKLLIDSNNLCRNHPQISLNLMNQIISENSKFISKLRDCLKIISSSSYDLSENDLFLKLRSYLD